MKHILVKALKLLIPIIITEFCVFTIHSGLVKVVRDGGHQIHELNREASSISSRLENELNNEVLKLKLSYYMVSNDVYADLNTIYDRNSSTDCVYIIDDNDCVLRRNIFRESVFCIPDDFSKSSTVKHLLSYARETHSFILSNVIQSDDNIYVLGVIPLFNSDEFKGYIVSQINFSEILDGYICNVSDSTFYNYSVLRLSYEGTTLLYGSNLDGYVGSSDFIIGDDTFRVEVERKCVWSMLLWILSIVGGLLVTVIILLLAALLREKHAENLIFKDTLTRAYNKRMLNKVFNEYIRENKPFAIIYLDINKFKEVNDLEGHSTGDMLLVNFADRVINSVKKKDKLFRVGGDEFVLLLDGSLTEENIKSIIRRIHNAVNNSFELLDTTVEISVSAGYSRYPEDSKDPLELIDIADTTMYKAKRSA